MDLNLCIKNAIQVMETGQLPFSKPFNEYDSIYSFTNENIKDYYKYFNYEGTVLSVASSGDHMLHSVLGGSKKIILFDINKLTKFYVDLKVAGIKGLTLEEFINYFTNRNLLFMPTLDYKTFLKFQKFLPQESYEFWNTIYEERKGFSIFDSYNLFNFPIEINYCEYLNPKTYEKLKKEINDVELSFIGSDIFELSKQLNENFSTIYFSNIFTYFNDSQRKQFYEYIEMEIDKFLDINGLLQYRYEPKNINEEPLTLIEDERYYNIDTKHSSVYVYKKVLR